jgi:hypothetical protein
VRASIHPRIIFFVACAAILAACGDPKPTSDTTVDGGAETDARGEGGPTCFVPMVRDPDFATTTTWSAGDEVVITPGAATFSLSAICDHRSVTQIVPTPPLSCARPLLMTVDVTLNDLDRVNFVFGFGGRWYAQLFAGIPTWSFCLGASAFDGTQTLAFGSAINQGVCPALPGDTNSITIQRLSIAEDVQGTCPLPGIVSNGDFEHGAASWTLLAGDGVAEIAPGRGEGASAGARIATDHPCEKPSVRGVISLPSSAMVPNPALRIWSSGPSDAIASVRMGPRPPDYLLGATYLPGHDAPVSSNICIPRWAQGTAQPLELAFAPMDYTESCPSPRAREFIFDGLSFVTEPACATDANVFDPGFEQVATSTSAAPFWALQRYEDNPMSDVQLVVDPTNAHSGMVAARFTGSSPCPVVSLSGGVTVPGSDGVNGPALKFWYSASATAHLALDVALGALSAPLALPATTSWTQVTGCLDPPLATRPDLLTFSLVSADGGGTCSNAFPMETILLDDVELTTDVSCPGH